MYFVYILYSKEIDRYYVGQTYDVGLRLERHALKTTRYTKQANDWELQSR
ncbi:MAG: GIY-YIG nuclease family protein [Candidatus Dojkabacteria bacterium]|nr:GIY-YIG nuclease family protein [Candidatus Dojkabacteria bacterium]MDQ7020423.1 GIY-YIG nuclease family protein [Candidatus Dojkabacteria bacterium]